MWSAAGSPWHSARSVISSRAEARRSLTPTGRTPTPATVKRRCSSRWSSLSGTRRAVTLRGARGRRPHMMARLSVFGPLLLVVSGSLLYHVAAKSVPKTLEPFGALIGVYATALAASLAAYLIVRRGALPTH